MKAEKEDGKAEEKAEKRARTARRVLIFSSMVTAVFFLPSTIVLTVCMIPALVAGLVEKQAQKTAWITVGAMNFAGSLPAWIMLLHAGNNIDAAFEVVLRPVAIMIAYGGAAIGWLIYNQVTPLVAGIVAARNERRLKDIDRRQKELVRKWGNEVVRR